MSERTWDADELFFVVCPEGRTAWLERCLSDLTIPKVQTKTICNRSAGHSRGKLRIYVPSFMRLFGFLRFQRQTRLYTFSYVRTNKRPWNMKPQIKHETRNDKIGGLRKARSVYHSFAIMKCHMMFTVRILSSAEKQSSIVNERKTISFDNRLFLNGTRKSTDYRSFINWLDRTQFILTIRRRLK